MLGQGLTDNEISVRLGISATVVGINEDKIYKRLGVHNRTQAVVRAIAIGAIRLEEVNQGLKNENYARLTDRQKEVLAALTNPTNESDDRKIAQNLAIAPMTVRHHLSHIMQKLGVRNRTQAAVFYLAIEASGKAKD